MNLSLQRKRLGKTQAEMAQLIGVDQTTVCGWEAGRWTPNVRVLPKVAEAYGVTVDEILSIDTSNMAHELSDSTDRKE